MPKELKVRDARYLSSFARLIEAINPAIRLAVTTIEARVASAPVEEGHLFDLLVVEEQASLLSAPERWLDANKAFSAVNGVLVGSSR